MASGTVAGLLAVLVTVGVLTDGFRGDSHGRIAQVGSTVVGACLVEPDDSGGVSKEVDCSQFHDDEVFAVKHLEGSWPGKGRLNGLADDFCYAHYRGYVGSSYEDSGLDYSWYAPDEAEWAGGERRVVCVVTGIGEQGSVRGSGD